MQVSVPSAWRQCNMLLIIHWFLQKELILGGLLYGDDHSSGGKRCITTNVLKIRLHYPIRSDRLNWKSDLFDPVSN